MRLSMDIVEIIDDLEKENINKLYGNYQNR